MISPVVNVFSIVVGVLTLYAIPCFLAHYLDFGWKFISGGWFSEDYRLIKWLRSGIVHKILIGFILIILLYAGLSEVFTIIPPDWGRVNAEGQIQPYRRILATVMAILLGVINMYAFNVAERHFKEKATSDNKKQ